MKEGTERRFQSLKRFFQENSIVAIPISIAVAFMSYGITYTRPYILDADAVSSVHIVLAAGAERTIFKPHFPKAGNLWENLLQIAFVPYYLILELTGKLSEVSAEISGFGREQTVSASQSFLDIYYGFFITGRMLSVFFGVLSVFTAYLLAKRIYNQRAGFLAGLIVALTSGFVNIAHRATEEILFPFLVVLTFYFLLSFYHTRQEKFYYLSSISLGLAAGSKALAGLLVIPVVFILFVVYKGDQIDNLGFPFVDKYAVFLYRTIITGFLSVLSYLATTPSIFAYHREYYEVVVLRYLMGDGIKNFSLQHSGLLINTLNLAEAFGLLLFIFIFVATGYLFYYCLSEKRYDLLSIFLFLVPYFVFTAVYNRAQYPRVMAMVPLLSIFGGIFADKVLDRDFWRSGLILLVVLGFSFWFVASGLQDFKNDSRMEASNWLEENLEEEVSVDVHSQYYYLPEFPDRVEVNRLVVTEGPNEDWDRASRRIEDGEPDYIVMTSIHYRRYLKDQETFPSISEKMKGLIREEERYKIIKTFGPEVIEDYSIYNEFEKSFRPNAAGRNPTIIVLERED